jgi:predicted enzyme related to lactoylglutathione lyase
VAEISVFRPGGVSYLAGMVPYIYMADIDETMTRITEHGGEVMTTPYPEGDLWVAMTRDPAGNAIGVWQHGPRADAS